MQKQNTKRKIYQGHVNPCQREEYGRVLSYPKKRKPSKRRHGRKNHHPFKLLFSCGVLTLSLCTATVVNFENFLSPVYINRINNRNIHYDANKIVSPTLDYANNLNFMGQNLLADVNTKGTGKVLKINSAGNMDDLHNEIKNILAEYPNLHAGVFVYDYMTGKTVKINEDEVFPAASIIKIPVLLDLFSRSDSLEKEGFASVDLNSKRMFKEENKAEGSGDLQYGPVDVEYTLDYLAKVMIRKSDNSATNMLIEENGGINGVNSSLRSWGLKNTRIGNWLPDLDGENVTTPEEMATLLYNINNQSVLSSKSASKVREIMSKVENRTLIKSQIPDGATLVHKTGDIGKMLGDAGIVYTPAGKKFIIVIMVKRPHNDYSARDLIQKTANSVYKKLGA